MKKIIKEGIKYLFPLMIGFGILYYLYRGVDMEELKQVLRSGVNWNWIALSLFFAMLSHFIRAIRWRYQLQALDINLPKRVLVDSVFGGYAVNLLLPRLGEIWRCNYIAKQSKNSFTTILGTLLAERVFDLFSIASLLLISFFITSDFYLSFFEKYILMGGIESKLTLLLFIAVAGVLLLVLAFSFRAYLLRYRWVQFLQEFLKKLLSGIDTIRKMNHKVAFILYTIAIWACYFLNFYIALLAFDFTSGISLAGGLTAFVMGSIAVVAPVQGGTGPWHFMIITALVFLGVNEVQAAIFALVVHAIQQLFVLLLGVYAFISIYLMHRNNSGTQLTVKSK